MKVSIFPASDPKGTPFSKRFPPVLEAMNKEMGLNIRLGVEITDSQNLSVEILCVAAAYLVHNLVRFPADASLPNIDTLANYNLELFRGAETLAPYARCLQRNCNNVDDTRGKKKVKITLSPEVVYSNYLKDLIRYLFVLQQKGARAVRLAPDII